MPITMWKVEIIIGIWSFAINDLKLAGNPTHQHLKIKYRTPKQFEVKIKLLKSQKSDCVEITVYICSINFIFVNLRQVF